MAATPRPRLAPAAIPMKLSTLPVLAAGLPLLFAIPAQAQGGRGEATLEALLQRVIERRDKVDGRIFPRIARIGTPAALETLKEAVHAVHEELLLGYGYMAFTLFAEDEGLTRDAIQFLFEDASSHRRDDNMRAAARGLAAFGERALPELEQLFRRHRDPALKRIAFQPLIPSMGERGTAKAAEAILEYALLERSPWRDRVRPALEKCEGADVNGLIGDKLSARGTSLAWKELLLDVLAGREGATVDPILVDALRDGKAAVRARALELLGRRGDRSLLSKFRRHLRAKDERERREAVVAVGRLAAGDPSWTRELFDLARSKNAGARMGAAVALAELRTGGALSALHRLAADEDWRVRAEALGRLGGLRRVDSIPVLIERLGEENGRLRRDVATVLRLVSGQDHGLSPARWREWWTAEGSGFRPPPYEQARAAEAARRKRRDENETIATFYGLEILSERVAFVLDVSYSMSYPAGSAQQRYGGRGAARGPTRMDVAKAELRKALTRISPGVRFNVIFFESQVVPWREKLVAVDEALVQEALAFSRRQPVGRGTNLYDGLMAAMADPLVDTVYLLSDGDPTEGQVVEPALLAERIGRLNRTRKVQIHGIAIGQSSPLLERLATESGGTYVESL